MKIVFETERLFVREWDIKDAGDLYEYASNPDITKFLAFSTYTTIDAAYERINFLKNKYFNNEINTDYAIELKSNNKVIGSIGIVKYDEKNEGCIEIGYTLNVSFQGNGYMTEALVGFFNHIKQIGIAKRIILKCDVANVKSENVMKRAGMTFEGILRKAGKNNLHSRHDSAIYSILEEEIH